MLFDTSVWIDHLRAFDGRVGRLLLAKRVRTHPFVLGELMLGGIRRSSLAIDLIRQLPEAPECSHEEVVTLVRVHKLEGAAIGWVDAHLLASAAAGGLRLLTHDRRQGELATRLGLWGPGDDAAIVPLREPEPRK